jgi:tetratricopeptide (TPR) repeat protein
VTPETRRAEDLAMADRFTAELVRQQPIYGLAPWNVHARCYGGMLLAALGEASAAVEVLQAMADEAPSDDFYTRYPFLLRELADALCEAGEVARARAAIDKALERSERHEDRSCIAKLLWIKGEIAPQTDEGSCQT